VLVLTSPTVIPAIHDPGLVGVEFQPDLDHPRRHRCP